MGPVHLILFLLAISVEGILAANPCNQNFNGSETVNPADIPPDVKNCTFNFSINANADTLMLVFSSLGSLISGENIVISAESKQITNISSGNDPVTVVSTSNVTVVTILKGSGRNATFKLVNKRECVQDVDPLSGFLASPVYLPPNKTITCTYNATSPDGQITLFGFANFGLKISSLAVAGTNVTVAAGKTLPDDLLIPSNTTIVLTIPSTVKTVEGFGLILSLVNSDCSDKDFNISNKFNYTSSSRAECHLMINGVSGSLVAEVLSWQTDLSDQLQFRDGFSQEDSLLNSSSSIQHSIMLVSTSSKMSVHLVFARTNKRHVEISFTSQVQGGLVKVGKNISYDHAKSGGKDGVFQCTLDAGKKVSLTNINMISNGMVEVYDGNVILGTPLFTVTNPSLPIPIFAKSNQMTIVAKNTSSDYIFSATTGEARACDQFSQPGLGTYAVNALGPDDNYTYNLIILPMTNEEYRGTLQLNIPSLCPDDKVTVFEGISTQKQLVEFTYNTTYQYQFIPQYIFGADKGARIVTALSKCNSRQAGDVVVTASYDMKTLGSLCGKTPSSPSGNVTSPYYPLRYPLNLNCQWTFENKTDSFLYVSVDQLNITGGSSLKLTGNITEFDFTADKTLGRDLIFSKSKALMLSFNSVTQNGTLVSPGEGFVINYEYLDCGGSTTVNFSASLGGARKDCRWIIGIPKTAMDSKFSNKDIINATIKVAAGYVAGSLIVYDGTSMKDAKQVNLTNLTVSRDLAILSHVDTLIIQYINNDATAKEFTLTVNITRYLCTDHCENGICMHPDWMCNGKNDCGDNTDELHCPIITTPSPPQPKPAPQPDKGDVPGFWLAIMLIIGLIVGILLPFIVPAIVRRMRKRNYNRMTTDMDNITADDYTPMD